MRKIRGRFDIVICFAEAYLRFTSDKTRSLDYAEIRSEILKMFENLDRNHPLTNEQIDQEWRISKDPKLQLPIRRLYEEPAMEIAAAIRRDYIPNLDEDGGGQILVWILDLVAIAVITELRKAKSHTQDLTDVQKMFVLLSEIRQCINDDHLMAAQRKIQFIETLLRRERWTAGS